MPNRIIRDSAKSSETLAELSDREERLFWRLTLTADDFGRFDARPFAVRADCFRAMLDRVPLEHVVADLDRLAAVGLVELYTNAGKLYGVFLSWSSHQQTRAKESKYPGPEADGSARVSTCQHVRADASRRQHVLADALGVGVVVEDGNEGGSGAEPDRPSPSKPPASGPGLPPTPSVRPALALAKGGGRSAMTAEWEPDPKLGEFCVDHDRDPASEAAAFRSWFLDRPEVEHTREAWRERFKKWVRDGVKNGYGTRHEPAALAASAGGTGGPVYTGNGGDQAHLGVVRPAPETPAERTEREIAARRGKIEPIR